MLPTEWQDHTICLSLVDTFFQNLSLPLIGWHDTVVSCQSVSQLSHQPSPVHWTCWVATWIVQSSGTNYPSHFVPKLKSLDCLVMIMTGCHFTVSCSAQYPPDRPWTSPAKTGIHWTGLINQGRGGGGCLQLLSRAGDRCPGKPRSQCVCISISEKSMKNNCK